ncbi:right-handed parallel beta-helix repeat-containing protein [Telluria beijingensis]|uniref:right-handed parallel beta-helix repeat-containing protein n=1 Tax=Telluria beijingensis TaxID=3068633 RepID=UPI00279524D8|nr:right-handed parallel beta-helix repeat-containing protein [Massilia sp. REN29]
MTTSFTRTSTVHTRLARAASTAALLGATLAAQAAPPATPYNFYVSPSGADTAAGTQDAPFQTLARAAQAATRAGTTVWVAPGTYAGGVQTTASGTASERIYWISTTKWGARIVPPARSSSNSAWDNRGDYVSIIGFDVDGSAPASGATWTHGIYTGGSFSVIEGNHVHDVATTIGCNGGGGSGIGVDSYYRGVQGAVLGNLVHDIGPTGCTHVQGIYMSTSGTVKNNVVYGIASTAIHLWHDARDVQIVNNTVASSMFGIIVGGGDFYFTSAGADDVQVHNNIVVDNQYGISEQGTTGRGNTYKNNLVNGNTVVDFQLSNGLSHSATVGSAPLFAATARATGIARFALSASSPAIGRGLATYAPANDIEGEARGASIDIGANQF